MKFTLCTLIWKIEEHVQKKIVRTFDYNFNVAIKFNVYNSGSIYGNSNISASFSFPPGLFEYKEADIDFTGLSRKGNLWRGSKLVLKIRKLIKFDEK